MLCEVACGLRDIALPSPDPAPQRGLRQALLAAARKMLMDLLAEQAAQLADRIGLLLSGQVVLGEERHGCKGYVDDYDINSMSRAASLRLCFVCGLGRGERGDALVTLPLVTESLALLAGI